MSTDDKATVKKPRFAELFPMMFSVIGSKPLELLSALFIPTLLIFLLGWLMETADLRWSELLLFSLLPIFTLFSTRLHRGFLLDERPTWDLRRFWGRRENIFMGYIILMVFLLLAVIGVVLLIENVVLQLSSIGVFAYLIARFSLVLPAAALGDPLSLKDAWQISRRHHWYVLGAVTGTTVILNVMTKPLDSIEGLPEFVEKVIALVEVVIMIGALSIAYREIKRYESTDPGADQLEPEARAMVDGS